MWVPDDLAEPSFYDVSVLPPDGVEKLPAFAKAGDLLVTRQTVAENASDIPPRAEARLWFCVVTGSSADEPAIWKQVLLGPSVEGKNIDKA
jgi:hypothetical protein